MPSIVWIIGRKVTMATNGHSYMAEPFIAFGTELEADAACDLVEKISGERPLKTTVSLMTVAAAEPDKAELH